MSGAPGHRATGCIKERKIMAPNYFFELSQLDHIVARNHTSYVLHFNTEDTDAARRTIEKGVQRLVSAVPFLAGNVTLSKGPESPINRARVSPSSLPVDQVPMLRVKYHDTYEFQDTSNRELHPLPLFTPFSESPPVLRFQANIFQKNARVVLAMTFHHHVMDGSGAEQILKAFSECCRASDDQTELTISSTIAEDEARLREKVSTWPSQCATRMDHSSDFGPDLFGVDITAEQFAQLEAQMSAAVRTRRFRFSPEKVRQVKDICSKLGTESIQISSNDVVTALVAIGIDQALNPSPTEDWKPDDNASVMMVVDMRARIRPPLPTNYVGNMIMPVHTELYPSGAEQSAATFGDEDLLRVARLAAGIRRKLQSMNEADVYSVAAMVEAQDNWAATGARPANAFFTSWRHLGVYEHDFGAQLGQVVDFNTDSGVLPGVCIILPPRVTGQDRTTAPWEVNLTMKPESFARFEDGVVSRILS